MKIWIDITNSPHVIFFEEFIGEFAKEHNVIITCRNLANTIDLLKLKNIEYYEIGKHAGGNILKKLLYFPKRVLSLRKFLKCQKIDISISHSSFYSPVTSWLLGKPSIYLNDNEHAKGNWISFLFATYTLIPEFLENLSRKQKWHMLTRIQIYPGTKECIYLKKIVNESQKRVPVDKKTIFFRPEPWTAQYYKGKRFFLDDVLLKLSEKYIIRLLPRGKDQALYYKKSQFTKIIIEDKPLDLQDIYRDCDLFIGAGGTMTRELAILGVPTISIYQDKLLAVDKFLIEEGYMIHTTNLNIEVIEQYISTKKIADKNNLLHKGYIAYNQIKETVLNFRTNE